MKQHISHILIFTFAVSFGSIGSPACAVDQKFLAKHCLDCHSGPESEGALDLSVLPVRWDSAHQTERWVRLYDRVAAGEMPPSDAEPVPPQERNAFLTELSAQIRQTQLRSHQELGRVQGRRLTNLQIERSLHDLLGIDIPLAEHFSADQKTHGYTTVASGQPMSHFQMEQHLEGVDRALEEAFARSLSASSTPVNKTFDAAGLSRTNPKRRCREPEIIDNHGVVWSSGLTFYGRIPATTARADGWFRFTVRAKALKAPEGKGVWCTVRRGRGVSSAPLLAWVGAFEAGSETREWTFETWLPAGEMLEIRPGDKTLKMARFTGGQVGTGEGEPQDVPGVAIESIRMQQIHNGPDDETIRSLLFDGLTIKPHRDWRQAEVTSRNPDSDLPRLLARFATQAFRRPVTAEVVQPYLDFARQELQAGQSFATALLGGYRAILCSPRFLYFHESPGKLDDFAIASRLSYFLWNRPPDGELLTLAGQGKLHNPAMLRKQLERMLDDPRGADFLEQFANEWLDLALIDFTEPDPRLYRTFDPIVQQSLVEETLAYLREMLDQNLSTTHFIQSDFTFLNSHLARYYQIEGVSGDELQKVALPADSQRGGLLTHGSLLKVTANGTTTSPVIRGVWISERLMGQEIPSPPMSVPAIEPDIRGATSIREQLQKHTALESCASCHQHIDPPGYALENFDPAGLWRDRYPAGRGKKGLLIDASFQFADGTEFNNFREFQSKLAARPEQLSRNIVKHLLTYGTGAPVSFADRPIIDKIVADLADDNYGLRSTIAAVITSDLFLSK